MPWARISRREPAPTPSTMRPSDSSSRAANVVARRSALRVKMGTTQGPMRMRLVLALVAAQMLTPSREKLCSANQIDSYPSSSARSPIATDSPMRRLLSSPNASFTRLPPRLLLIGLLDQRNLLATGPGKRPRLQQFDAYPAVQQLMDPLLDRSNEVLALVGGHLAAALYSDPQRPGNRVLGRFLDD